MHTKFRSEKLKERDHLEDLGIDEVKKSDSGTTVP
jgi:hypothetical protein